MVKVEQIYTGCLSQAAYYIESNAAGHSLADCHVMFRRVLE